MKKTRKSHVIGLVFGLVLLLACIVVANLDNIGAVRPERPAKYVFLFIGDGMGASHVAAAESYLSWKEDGEKRLRQLSFTGFPVLGMTATWSADRNVTCSSAAGTAIACGVKTCNGRLGITPDGDTLESLAVALKEKGYKIGIMSSVPVNHATPAAFYGHNTDRHDYYSITREIPASGFDFFAGAGFIDYAGKSGDMKDSRSLLEEGGYTVCFGADEFDKRKSEATKMVLCQETGRDRNASEYRVEKSPGTDISSGEMMNKCLEFLGDKSPFFIMYEQGEIDWAAHENKTMPMIESILKLDEAVKAALAFYRTHPDETLIIVTADHETGGLALGATSTWNEVDLGWKTLDSIWVSSGYENNLDYGQNRAMNDSAFIGWTTRGHTGGPVPVYAIGRGSERFAGRFDNTGIREKILPE